MSNLQVSVHKQKHLGWLIVVVLILLFGMHLHLTSGSMEIDWSALIQGLNQQQSLVFWEIRVPRLILVAMVGIGLAVSGVVLQALFRNPLAEPGLIGISSSSALGAVFVIVLGGAIWQEVAAWQISFAAMFSGLLATWLIYRLATHYGRTDVAMMLLAGVAINAIAGAATQMLVTVSDDTQLRTVTFWMMGSFTSANWQEVALLTLVITILLALFWRMAKSLNALLLGENICLHMGHNPTTMKWQIMWGSAVMVGLAVATVGVIGFVGLIVPHIARLFVGTNHKLLIPLSALMGAVLLIYADWLAKTLIAPAELPIGLFMALLGGPFFLMMLFAQRKTGW